MEQLKNLCPVAPPPPEPVLTHQLFKSGSGICDGQNRLRFEDDAQGRVHKELR